MNASLPGGHSGRPSTHAPRFFALIASLMLAFLSFAGSALHAQVYVRIQPVLFSSETPPAPPLVAISPNPAGEMLTIQAAQDVHFIGLTIRDADGALKFEGTYSTNVVWNATLNPGLHYFHVETDQGTAVVSVLIQEP